MPIVLSITTKSAARDVVYWVLNMIFPSINAQVIITDALAKKSEFCTDSAMFVAEIFPSIGDNTIWVNWLILASHIIILLSCIIMIDTGFLRFNFRRLPESNFNENLLDDDVRAERHRVLSSDPTIDYQHPVNTENLDEQWKSDHLTVHDLVKRYGGSSATAVNHLTFGAKRGEAFGLLGYNVSTFNRPPRTQSSSSRSNRVLEKQRRFVYLSAMKSQRVVLPLLMDRISLIVYDPYVVLVIVLKSIVA